MLHAHLWRVGWESGLWNALECNLYSFCAVCLQLSSMQQVVREKDARFETQVRLHEDELLQLVTQSDVETEMQQVCCSHSVEWLSFWLTSNQDFPATSNHCPSLLPFPAGLRVASTCPLASYWCPGFHCISFFVLSLLSIFPHLIRLEHGTLNLNLLGDLCGSQQWAGFFCIWGFTAAIHVLP